MKSYSNDLPNLPKDFAEQHESLKEKLDILEKNYKYILHLCDLSLIISSVTAGLLIVLTLIIFLPKG